MPNWSARVDHLTEQEAGAIEAEDWGEVNRILDQWKDLWFELRHAIQNGDKSAETEIKVLYDVRRRHHPLITAKCAQITSTIQTMKAEVNA